MFSKEEAEWRRKDSLKNLHIQEKRKPGNGLEKQERKKYKGNGDKVKHGGTRWREGGVCSRTRVFAGTRIQTT